MFIRVGGEKLKRNFLNHSTVPRGNGLKNRRKKKNVTLDLKKETPGQETTPNVDKGWNTFQNRSTGQRKKKQ